MWALQKEPGVTGENGTLWLTGFESHQYYGKMKKDRFLTAGFSAFDMLMYRENFPRKVQQVPHSNKATKP